MQIFMSFYGGQLKQQICYSFSLSHLFESGPDWSCGQEQICLFLKIDLAEPIPPVTCGLMGLIHLGGSPI